VSVNDEFRIVVALAQLNAVRQLHKAHPMPFDASSPVVYDVNATTNVCRHCSVLKGVPVVWPCETAAYANADLENLPASLLPEGEDEWTY
jgi:hypothetical protein